MRTRRVLVAFLPAFAAVVLPALAAVTVTYSDPDRFTDAGDRSSDPRKIMLALERHLVQLGERYLPPKTDLRIEVLDLDRAGRPRMNLPTEVRIVTGRADMPCIELQYSPTAEGQPAQTRKERVCDPEYLERLAPGYDSHDPLVYEKRMLDRWFRDRFAKGGKAP